MFFRFKGIELRPGEMKAFRHRPRWYIARGIVSAFSTRVRTFSDYRRRVNAPASLPCDAPKDPCWRTASKTCYILVLLRPSGGRQQCIFMTTISERI